VSQTFFQTYFLNGPNTRRKAETSLIEIRPSSRPYVPLRSAMDGLQLTGLDRGWEMRFILHRIVDDVGGV
jgi:hypothetical protein